MQLVDQESLKKLLTGKSAASPLIIKNFTGLKSRDKFTCAAKNAETVMLGTQNGALYSMTDIPESELYSIFAITENMYQKIYDIDSDETLFYLLTKNAIFKTSYDTKAMYRLGSSFSHTNILKYNDSLILWSKGTQRPVQQMSLDGSEDTKILFTPSAQLKNLRVFKNKIVYILGTSIVTIYDMGTGANSTVYTGTSVQDAVLVNENLVVVAKTSTGKGDSAVVSVNTQTKETVPLKFNGDVVFSLSYDENKENSPVYGISINSVNGTSKTFVFSYYPKSGIQNSLFTLQSEDAAAFTELEYPFVFTNIGKNQVRSYNISAGKTTVFRRSASMPLKAAASKDRVAVLNYNGSISWYNPSSQILLADWYLTTDGDWIEF